MLDHKIDLRRPVLDDAQLVLDLMARCEIKEYGESDSDMEDLMSDWGQIDLNQDAWLATNEGGELVGYSAVQEWMSSLRFEFFDDPNWKNDDLAQRMVSLCIKRGRELVESHSERDQIVAKTFVAHVNQRDQRVLEGAGFYPSQYHFQMHIPLDSPIPEPDWSAGITLRTANPEMDGGEIHALIEAAFAWPDRTPTTFDEWVEFMMRPDIFNPDIWYLAIADGKIVGTCLCFAYPDIGWVRQLAVDEGWRRRGLGTAFLRHAFSEFKRQGYKKAGLVVAGDNPDAYNMYKKAGMKRFRQYDEYQITLG